MSILINAPSSATNNMHTHHSSKYFPAVDGLRAIAIIAVILFHLKASILPGGYAGVDIFFAISGYVVSASLAHNFSLNFKEFLLGFYARRIIRIYPALIVSLLVTAIFADLFIPASWLSSTSSKTALYAFFGMSNFSLVWFDDGYFSPRMEFNAFTHTWSLGVEEQFYLLFPLLFFFWMKCKEKVGLVGVAAKFLLPLILFTSFSFCAMETHNHPSHAFYLLPSRFWELACGAILFQLHHNGCLQIISKKSSNILVVIGLILIGLALEFTKERAFPYPWALLPIAGAICIMAGAIASNGSGSFIHLILENRLMVFLGRISYSLYIWHWPIFVLMRWTIGVDALETKTFALVTTLLLALASHYLLELNIKKITAIFSSTHKTIVLRGVFSVLLGFALCATILSEQPAISLSVTKDRENWYPEAWAKKSPIQEQKYQGRNLFAFGDSHASAFTTMLQKLHDEQGVEIHQFSQGGCSVAGLRRPSAPECAQFVSGSLEKIENMAKPGDVIFLASLRMNRLGDEWKIFDKNDIAQRQSTNEQLLDATKEADEVISKLEAKSMTIIIDAPMPVFGSPPFRCADWFNAKNSICASGFKVDVSYLNNSRKPVMDAIKWLQNKHPHLMVWDTIPILCNTEKCDAFNNGEPLFFDGDHLSAYGNKVLYPNFLELLDRTWQHV